MGQPSVTECEPEPRERAGQEVDGKEPRRPGVAKHWAVDGAALLAPTEPEDLDWAEGRYTDEMGITRQRRR
jgi:hypothetical protein